jgi:hypothetical protein
MIDLQHSQIASLRRAGVIDVTPAVVSGAGHFPHEEAASPS